MLTSLYVDCDSPVHGLPPGRKLLALVVVCTLLFVVESMAVVAAGLLAVCGLTWLAGIPARVMFKAVKPALWVLALIFIAQLFLADLHVAVFVVLRFLTMIMAASLVTLTTRTSDLVEGIERGLSVLPAWVPAEKISLAISLCIRFIPMVRDVVAEVRNAQKARGMDRDLTALAVPTVVRTLKSADEIAQAIHARSREPCHDRDAAGA